MKLLDDLIVLTCPECNKDLHILTRQAFPLIKAWKCIACGWEHVERQNYVKKQLKLDKPKPEKKNDKS